MYLFCILSAVVDCGTFVCQATWHVSAKLSTLACVCVVGNYLERNVSWEGADCLELVSVKRNETRGVAGARRFVVEMVHTRWAFECSY